MLRIVTFARAAMVLTAVAVVASFSARTAEATPPFFKQFRNIYITDETDEEFAKHVTKEAKCYVCHQGKKKKNRNSYGEQFKGLLTKKEKDVDKIVEAIKKVGKMKSDSKDDKSPTYDELIAKGELPGGKLEDLKKEPGDKGSDKKDGSDKKKEGSDKKKEGSDKK